MECLESLVIGDLEMILLGEFRIEEGSVEGVVVVSGVFGHGFWRCMYKSV